MTKLKPAMTKQAEEMTKSEPAMTPSVLAMTPPLTLAEDNGASNEYGYADFFNNEIKLIRYSEGA